MNNYIIVGPTPSMGSMLLGSQSGLEPQIQPPTAAKAYLITKKAFQSSKSHVDALTTAATHISNGTERVNEQEMSFCYLECHRIKNV